MVALKDEGRLLSTELGEKTTALNGKEEKNRGHICFSSAVRKRESIRDKIAFSVFPGCLCGEVTAVCVL